MVSFNWTEIPKTRQFFSVIVHKGHHDAVMDPHSLECGPGPTALALPGC